MSRIPLKLVLILVVSCYFCSSYKILVVFPIPGKSHSILGEAFVKLLLNAGHEVTYITPILMKSGPAALRQIDVSSNFDVMPPDFPNMEKLRTKEVDLFDMSVAFGMMNVIANSTLMNNNVQMFLQDPREEYDAIIAEWMYTELYAGFAAVFNCPLIWSSSMEPHYLVLSLIDEDVNPAYTSDVFTTIIPPYTFAERVSKLWSYVTTRYEKWIAKSIEKSIYESAYSSAVARRGRELPPYEETMYNASLMFGNSHVSAGQSLRLPQNYIPILGYHIEPSTPPLSQDLQKIMDNGEFGIIYFSMGSMLKSKEMPNEIKRGILDVFAELKYTFVWKFEEQLENVSKNLHIVNWAPQQSILGHPNCVLFITHGGLLSISETLHFGVPIIGIPMFADQFNNVNRAVAKGFGKRVDLSLQTPAELKAAIVELIENPRYKEKVKELSFVYRNRPLGPRAQVVRWVEHVVRTRGAPQLRSPALDIPFYKKMYLDLIGLLICLLLLVLVLYKFLLYSVKKRSPEKMKNKLN